MEQPPGDLLVSLHVESSEALYHVDLRTLPSRAGFLCEVSHQGNRPDAHTSDHPRDAQPVHDLESRCVEWNLTVNAPPELGMRCKVAVRTVDLLHLLLPIYSKKCSLPPSLYYICVKKGVYYLFGRIFR